jgi:hypothetical protein
VRRTTSLLEVWLAIKELGIAASWSISDSATSTSARARKHNDRLQEEADSAAAMRSSASVKVRKFVKEAKTTGPTLMRLFPVPRSDALLVRVPRTPNSRMIPILNLNPDQEISADQIVLVANGKLQIETEDGERVGILLRRKDRSLLNDAVAMGYLKYSGKQTHLGEVFCCWCDAKEIPCVSFEIEHDLRGHPSTNEPLEKVDPFVTLRFDVVTAGRPFTKAGLVALTEHLLGKLWILALSPWMICAGILPLSQARQMLTDVYRIWDTTSEPKSGSGFPTGEALESSASHTVQ